MKSRCNRKLHLKISQLVGFSKSVIARTHKRAPMSMQLSLHPLPPFFLFSFLSFFPSPAFYFILLSPRMGDPSRGIVRVRSSRAETRTRKSELASGGTKAVNKGNARSDA